MNVDLWSANTKLAPNPAKWAGIRQLHWHRRLDIERPTCVVEELHQIAGTRTQRRLHIQVTSPNVTSRQPSWRLTPDPVLGGTSCDMGTSQSLRRAAPLLGVVNREQQPGLNWSLCRPSLPVTALREIRHWHSCLTVLSNQKHRIDGAFTSRCYQRGSLGTPRSLKYLLRGANSCSR